jgi:N-acetylglutamate synthase-like GNAT family acetyltransferase
MISIRKATLKDNQVISKLLVTKYSFTTLQEAGRSFRTEFQQHNHFRIAEDGGIIVGLLSWRAEGTAKHGVAELTRLAVLSDYAAPLAVKEALFDVMIAEADNYYRLHGSRLRKVFSMIHADSKHLRQFFLDKGMRQEAVLRSHFHQGIDELVFSMFLA